VRLLLMRHGQTHANVSGELDTAHPGLDLTPLGRAQAEAAARAIADEPLDAVYVSSRVRTHQTAGPTATSRGLGLSVAHGLEEVAAGDFEMRSDHDAVAGYIGTVAAWLEGDLARRMPGGETGEEFLARFDAAVAPPPTEPLHNTALIVLEGSPGGGWRMVSWQGHPVGGHLLEDPTAEDPTGDLDSDGDGEIG
jgi:broad specificity phosphatase PhoE